MSPGYESLPEWQAAHSRFLDDDSGDADVRLCRSIVAAVDLFRIERATSIGGAA